MNTRKKSYKPMYRTTDGEWTRSTKKYLASWRKMQRALEEKIGARVYGFDPDFAVVSKCGKGYAQIPMWLAREITGIRKVAP